MGNDHMDIHVTPETLRAQLDHVCALIQSRHYETSDDGCEYLSGALHVANAMVSTYGDGDDVIFDANDVIGAPLDSFAPTLRR
jgi:hypothetical protein